VGKATFPDGSVREVTPANKQAQLSDYMAQSQAAGRNVDVQGTSSAFDQLAGGPPAASMSTYQPGGGSSFFAGLEELFNKPTDAVKDATGIGTATYVPDRPGGGSNFLAGLEETATAPHKALGDLWDSLPTGPKLYVAGGLIVAGIVGLAYLAHKVG
jgi:hypothetical protein